MFLVSSGAFEFQSELRTVRLYPSTGGLYVFVMAAEIIYLLFILYYMFVQVRAVISPLHKELLLHLLWFDSLKTFAAQVFYINNEAARFYLWNDAAGRVVSPAM